MMVDYAPVFDDLEMYTKYDLDWIYPDLQVVIPFSDGTVIKARKLVASNVDVLQSVFRFLGDHHISPEFSDGVRKFRCDRLPDGPIPADPGAIQLQDPN
ncbi:MAG: hypothetical protein JRF53_13480 [Deltaproteobacteria bacterium]|nr:hypothetical protein [Deltaproteobacteria bacterium]MBW2344994.1 hypothetical protein [Deltaproteobacteria bacterium]